MSELLVRELVNEDFDQWLNLWDGYNAFYGRSGATALPAEVTKLTWQRLHDGAEPIFALVAVDGAELVGLAHYLFHLSSTSAAPVCYLRDLYTSPRSRGRGVGTTLIDRVCKEARSAGSMSIYWQTHQNNDVARRMYDKVGQKSDFIIYQKATTSAGHEK